MLQRGTQLRGLSTQHASSIEILGVTGTKYLVKSRTGRRGHHFLKHEIVERFYEVTHSPRT